MSRRRRVAMRVVQGVVVGAICAVLSAWVPEVADYALSGTGTGSWVSGDDCCNTRLQSEHGDTLALATIWTNGYGICGLSTRDPFTADVNEPSRRTPWWARPISRSLKHKADFFPYVIFAYGWPAPCLRWRNGIRAVDSTLGLVRRSTEGVWILHKGAKESPLKLAIDPLWPGLIANTAFYGILFVGGASLIRTIRRRRRLARGRCVECGYDLAGVTLPACPECGRERAAKPSAAPA